MLIAFTRQFEHNIRGQCSVSATWVNRQPSSLHVMPSWSL